MIKYSVLTVSCAALTASLLLAGNGLAGDEYDVRAYGPKSSIVWQSPIKATFDHQVHTGDVGIECSTCHDDIFSMQRGTAVNSKKFTMKAMSEGKFCGVCHNGDDAFATDTNCMACHSAGEDPIIWEEPTKAAFSHSKHVEELELSCSDCHSGTFSMKVGASSKNGDFTMTSFKEGKYCGSCHNGDDAFDSATQCESCHFPPEEKIVFSSPVKSVVFDHNIHVSKEELSCESCHKDVFIMKMGTVAESELSVSEDPDVKRKHLVDLHSKYCGTCHDSSQAFGYLTRCTVCHIGVKGYDQLNGGEKKETSHGSGH